MKLAANVLHGHQYGQSSALGTLYFVVAFPQFGFDKGQVELRVKVRFRSEWPGVSDDFPIRR